MKVLLIMEWDNPKDQERRNQYTELARSSYEFWDKYSDVKFERLGSWTDNTGHIISLMLYDSMEEYGKMWDDLEFHRRAVQGWRSVDNYSVRVCRPATLDPATLEETAR